jgi:hypothetical protein
MAIRRDVIAGGAAAALLAGLGYRAYDRGAFSSGTGPAFAPWQQWQGKTDDGPLRPLHAAILASNAHNAQPWLFAPSENTITLYADRSRNLGHADPFRREMYLSLGCALANLQIAAARFDWEATIRLAQGRLEPSRAIDPIEAATVALRPQQGADASLAALFDAIPLRHTHRGAYMRERKVAPAALATLFGRYGEHVRIVAVTEKPAREDISSIIMEATDRFIADRQMSEDSGRWFRTGRREIQQHRDGISTDTAGLSPLMAAMAKLLPDQSVASADQYWRTATRDVQIPTAALFGIVLVRDRMDEAQALAAGRAWQIFHLTATRLGLAAQPLNQPVEMADRNLILGRQDFYKSALAALTEWKDWDPTFVFRLGYGERAANPSARRPLASAVRLRRFA